MAPSPTPTLPALPDRAMMTSDELDWLVYSYLEESGYHHTSFSLLHESNLARPAHEDDDADEGEDHVKRNPVMDHVVPPGHLVRLLQKALLYLEAEARYRNDPPEAIPRIVGYTIPTTLPLPPLPKHVPPPGTTGDVKGAAKGIGSSKPKLVDAAAAGETPSANGSERSSTATKKPKKKAVAVAGETPTTTTTTAVAASAVPEAGPSRKAKTPAPSEAAPPPPPGQSKQTMDRPNSGGRTGGAGPSSVVDAPPSSSKGKERAVAETTTTEAAIGDTDVHMEDAMSASASNSTPNRPNGRRASVSAGTEAPPTTTKRKEKNTAASAPPPTTTTAGPAKREREKDDLRPPPAKKSAATLVGSSSSGQQIATTTTTTTASGKRSASPSVPRKSKPTAPPPPPAASSDATSLPAATNPSSSLATNPPATSSSSSSSSASSTSALAVSTTTSSSGALLPPPPPPPLHPPPPTTTSSASAPNKFRITTTTKTVSTPVTVSSSSHHHSHSQSGSGSSGGGGGGGGGGPPPISAAQLAADKRRRGSGESGATTSGSGKEGDRSHHKIKTEAGGGGANDGPPGHANGAKGKGGGGGGGGGPKSPTKPPSPLKEFDMRGVREIGDDDPRVVRLKGHTVAKVQPCAFNSKVPSLLATGGGDSTCRIWDVPPFTPTDLKSQAATTVTEHIVCKHQSAQRRCDITCVAWNPSGSLLATGSEDGIVRIWTPSGDLHLVLSMHQRQVCSLKWNPMGTMLLTSSLDQTVCLWEVNSGKVRQQYATHSDTVLDVDWNDDQTWASASMDKTVHLMSLSRTTPLHRFRGHRDEVNVVKFSPCGTLVASCSDDSTVRIWSLRNIPALARDIAAKPVKKGDESRRIDRDEEDGGAGGVFVLEGHDSDVHQIAWHPDAGKPTASGPRLLASCSFDSTAKLWDADAGTCLYTFSRASDYVYSIAFEPVSGRYVATGSNDGRLDIYRVEDRALVTEYKHSGPIYEITWHPHGQQIAVCGQSDIVGVVGFEPSKAA